MERREPHIVLMDDNLSLLFHSTLSDARIKARKWRERENETGEISLLVHSFTLWIHIQPERDWKVETPFWLWFLGWKIVATNLNYVWSPYYGLCMTRPWNTLERFQCRLEVNGMIRWRTCGWNHFEVNWHSTWSSLPPSLTSGLDNPGVRIRCCKHSTRTIIKPGSVKP